MATLLTGKSVVERMAQGLAPRIDALVQAGVAPTLTLVRVGERPDDLSYERTAVKRAEALGIAVRRTMLDELAPQEALEAALIELNCDSDVHGCLLFRPLPSFMDEGRVCELLVPDKDVDGISVGVAGLGVHRRAHGLPAVHGGRLSGNARPLPASPWPASTWWWWGAAWSSASRCP